MTQTLSRYANYQAAFQSLDAATQGSSPSWLRQLRHNAWERFQQLGFPTARRGNEKWKYTSVAPIASALFDYSPSPVNAPAVSLSQLGQLVPSAPDWNTLVFVEGCFAPALSTQPVQGGPVLAGSLAQAASGQARLVQEHLSRLAKVEDDGFTALNTAFLQEGAVVHVPDGAVAPAVVHLVHVAAGSPRPRVIFPRTLIVAGANSQLTLVESYVSLSQSRYFTNAVTEIVVGEGAKVDHYRLLLESPEAFHVGATCVCQGQDSSFTSGGFFRGAALARNDFQVLMDGTGAFCTLNGLFLTTDNQHIDHLLNIDHAKPHGASRLFYKGILGGKSKAVFGGTVLVHKDAQKTDARQTDKNLLLSPEAEVDSKPSLLIYADDVKCGHGATAGHIDENTLFYMRSRGLDLETASRMLIHAFAREVIDTVQPHALQVFLDVIFSQSLPSASLKFGGAP
ncbi:MAG: Fe-S cluster assembly protein SufD [SAR202 cluster bacterium]|nr:Fe-S cluster assembly protein SufD [SAR202 cluster bacterium]